MSYIERVWTAEEIAIWAGKAPPYTKAERDMLAYLAKCTRLMAAWQSRPFGVKNVGEFLDAAMRDGGDDE